MKINDLEMSYDEFIKICIEITTIENDAIRIKDIVRNANGLLSLQFYDYVIPQDDNE